MDLSAASAFAHVITEFLQNLCTCFPENNGPAAALAMLQMAGDAAHPAMASAWHKFSRPIVDAIRDRNAAVVTRAFDESEYQMMRQLRASDILAPMVDEETRASVWKYLDSLTALSELAVVGAPVSAAPAAASVPAPAPAPAPAVAPMTPADQVVTEVAPVAAAVQAAAAKPAAVPVAPAAPAQPPRPADVLKGITSAIPEIFKSINDVLKSDENGPLSSLIKQMVNPDQLQSGFAGNLAANMRQEPDTAVMEQVSAETGLTAAMIQEKLRRLELYEKRRNKKKH